MTVALIGTPFTDFANSSSLLESITVDPLANFLLVKFASYFPPGAFTTITYAGVPLTPLVQGYDGGTNTANITICYLPNPPKGVNNLNLVFSNARAWAIDVTQFGGVDPVQPFRLQSNGLPYVRASQNPGTGPSLTVVAGDLLNDYINDFLASNDSTVETVTPSGTQTQEITQVRSSNGSQAVRIASSTDTLAASNTLAWTIGASVSNAQVAFALASEVDKTYSPRRMPQGV